MEQEKGLISVCVMSCSFNPVLVENSLLHPEHSNDLSPVCIISCLVKWLLLVNRFSHTVHLNGFSPVWVLLWISKQKILVNFFVHIEQACLYGRFFTFFDFVTSWCNSFSYSFLLKINSSRRTFRSRVYLLYSDLFQEKRINISSYISCGAVVVVNVW
jgi:hypothetical protein